jgi:hypothetical protein
VPVGEVDDDGLRGESRWMICEVMEPGSSISSARRAFRSRSATAGRMTWLRTLSARRRISDPGGPIGETTKHSSLSVGG